MKKILLIILMAIPFLVNAQVQAPGTAEASFSSYLARAGWTATSNTGNGPDGPYAGLFDGDVTTFWNSNYGNIATNVYPHILTIDMLSDQSYSGIMIRPRVNSSRVPQSITFRKSDTGIDGSWTDIITVTAANSVVDQLFYFPSSHTSRYLQVELTTGYGDENGELAEIAPFTTTITDNTAYSRTGWIATGDNTHGQGGTGDSGGYTALVDNNAATYWHTRWGAGTAGAEGTIGPFPGDAATNSGNVTLNFDILSNKQINQISFVTRIGYNARNPNTFTVAYSTDGTNYTTLGPFVNTVINLANPDKIFVALGVNITARYLRINITKINKGGTSTDPNTSLAEFRAHYNATLPVELTSFAAKSNGSSVSLKWTTATESNASHFDVTRSTDGSKFAPIGKVNVTGSGSAYNYTDFSPIKGNNYYQLISVDNDGTSKKSSVEVAKVAGNDNELTVTAITSSSITANVFATKATIGTLTTSNVIGQKISTQTVKLAEGSNTITVSTAAVKGLIILSLNTAEGTLSKKIIK
ncbi:MAG: discoidin domain-containing protein [Flavobacteriales bacterium]|nr:MAG: discoidin domain-containing protein [Flavobacteriales bacterium]